MLKPNQKQDKFIVKVQISLTRNSGKKMMLVYNYARNLRFEDEATTEILALMKGSFKKFFWATMKGSKFLILEEAKNQNW